MLVALKNNQKLISVSWVSAHPHEGAESGGEFCADAALHNVQHLDTWRQTTAKSVEKQQKAAERPVNFRGKIRGLEIWGNWCEGVDAFVGANIRICRKTHVCLMSLEVGIGTTMVSNGSNNQTPL